MKYQLIIAGLLVAGLISCQPNGGNIDTKEVKMASYDSTDRTNDFYDNEPTVSLPGSKIIEVSGEIEKNQKVDISLLPTVSLIVKETKIENGEIQFIGAFFYNCRYW